VAVLGESVPTADDLGDVVELELARLVRELALEGARDHRVVDGEDEDLVVGQQALGYGLAEPESVELRPE